MSDAPASERPIDESHYRLHVFVCTNERAQDHPRGSCARRGSEALLTYLKARCREHGIAEPTARVQKSGCLERCELGPVLVIYPDAVWYRADTREDLDEILAVHLLGGGRVERLRLRPGQTAR